MKQYITKIRELHPEICLPLEIYLKSVGNNHKCHESKTKGVFTFPKETGRVVVFGDIHGDFELLLSLFLKSGVINENLDWIGKDTIVVQMGDLLDRGGRGVSIDTDNPCEEVDILQFLEVIHKKAQKSNGHVLCLFGNHELMNLLGDFRYTSVNTNKCFVNRREMFSPGSKLCKKIACLTYGILKIDDWIFVHGGLLDKHLESYHNKPDEFIEMVNNLTFNIINGNKSIKELSKEEESLLLSEDALMWTRKLNTNCDLVHKSYQMLGLENGGIVVGHTPVRSIKSSCNEHYWMVDTGASKAFGNKTPDAELLEIKKTNKGYVKKIIS